MVLRSTSTDSYLSERGEVEREDDGLSTFRVVSAPSLAYVRATRTFKTVGAVSPLLDKMRIGRGP